MKRLLGTLALALCLCAVINVALGPVALLAQDSLGGGLYGGSPLRVDGTGWSVKTYTAAPTALTAALVLAAGNVDIGSHSYVVQYTTAGGTTGMGTVSNTVVNDGTHQQNALTGVPVGTGPYITQRLICRNKVADQTHWFLQQTIANNTATTGVQDNTADAGLGAQCSTTNGAVDSRLILGSDGTLTVTNTIVATLSGKLASAFPVAMGTGTGTSTVGGTYAKFVSSAGVGNGADLTNDPVWTLTSIPANSFTANGDALVLTLGYKTGATVNNKTVGLTVGGFQNTSNALNASAQSGLVTWTVQRVDATHVHVFVTGTINTGFGSSNLNVAVADLTTNSLAIVVTAASPTTGAANDMVLYTGLAEWKK
jgi:hypothetical protein